MTCWTETAARLTLRARSAGWCELAIPGVCDDTAASVHHRQHRSQGGTWQPANLLHACGSGTTGCHGWVEHHPRIAQHLGWWLQPGQPLTTPVWMRTPEGQAWWCMTDELRTWADDLEPPDWLALEVSTGTGWPPPRKAP